MTKQRMGVLVLALFLMGGLASCDTSGLTEAVDDFGVIIGLEEINTGATVLFTDAATGQLIDETVTITFAGDNGSDVIDFYSDPLPEDEVEDGILNFGLSNAVTPSSANPARVTLQLSAPGYISANKAVSLTDSGFVDFSISLVNKNNKPSGVKSTTASASTNSDGSLAEDLSVSSDTTDGSDSGTSLSISSGTALTDANGNSLSGQLTAEMTNYDPGDPAALENLPFEIETEDGEPAVVLGMSAIEVTDENGRTAAGSPDASKAKDAILATQFTVEVAVSSQAGLDIGDRVSFEASDFSGGYTNQTENIVDLGNGRKGVRVTQSYLPKVTTVYHSASNVVAYTNPTIERNGYDGAVKGVAYSYGFSSGFIFPGSVALIYFKRGSNFFELHLSAPVDHVQTFSSLPSKPLTITLPPAPSNLIDAEVDVSVGCSNPNEKLAVENISQASLVYRKAGSTGKWRVITEIGWTFDNVNNELTGASLNLYGVEGDETYEYTLKIGGEDPYNGEVTITDSDSDKDGVQVIINREDIDGGICS